jgi:outer membrane lipoprotein-sorting protein
MKQPIVRAVSAAALTASLLATLSRSGFAAPPQPGGPPAQDLFEQMLRRYAGFHDFQARFVETAISRASGEGTSESGTVSFKRPDLWRWEYLSPERKVVVVRGKIAAIAVEGDPEVPRYDLGDGSEPSGVASLLAGGEKLTRSFSARFEPSGSKEEPVLRLDPLSVSEEYDYVLVRLRRRDAVVREVMIVDPGGNRLRFEFENLQSDRGLPDSLFALPETPVPAKQ